MAVGRYAGRTVETTQGGFTPGRCPGVNGGEGFAPGLTRTEPRPRSADPAGSPPEFTGTSTPPIVPPLRNGEGVRGRGTRGGWLAGCAGAGVYTQWWLRWHMW